LLAARSQGSVRLELWYLVAPPAGNATLSWTKSGARQNTTWGVSVYSGVDQSSPFGAAAVASGAQAGASARGVSVAAAAGRLVVGGVVFNGGLTKSGPNAADGLASLWSRTMSTTQGAAATAPASGGTTVLSWTPSGSGPWDWAAAAAPLNPATATTVPTGVGPTNTQPPSVTGSYPSLAGPNTLTANPGTWSGSGTIRYAYQWLACDPEVGAFSCEPIAGATQSTYVASPDGPYTLTWYSVRVAATDANGTTRSTAGSDGWWALFPPLTNTAAPTVGGTPQVGATLTATLGSWVGL